MLTLNQIIRRIKTIALAHKQVKNFYYGNVTDFLNDKTTRYASVFIQDNQGAIDVIGNAISVNIKMYCLDLENVSDSTQLNSVDVQSDMLSVAADLIAMFEHSNYLDWRLTANSNLALVREEFDDMVAGCVVDITIQIPYNKDTCAVPIAGGSEIISPKKYDYYLVYNTDTRLSGGGLTFTDPYLLGKSGYAIYAEQLSQFFSTEQDVDLHYDSSAGLVTILTPGFELIDNYYLVIYPNKYDTVIP